MPATPGPWRFDRKSGFVEKATEKPFEKVVCFIRGSAEDEEACANGALIAVAPDMVNLLELAESLLNGDRALLQDLSQFPGFRSARQLCGDLEKALTAIRGVLAKAKGVTLQ